MSQLTTFVNKYYPYALQAAQGTGIFPKVIIAQAALESGNGNSALARTANNFFGIKADSSWKGPKVQYKTQENVKGKLITVQAWFRKYASALQSFQDYIKFLNTARYRNAGVFTAKTEIQQFAALKKAGYATASDYVAKLSKIYAQISPAAKVAISVGTITALALTSYLIYRYG